MADERTAQRASSAVEPASFTSRPDHLRGNTCALEICPCCASPLVHPLDWAPAGKRWRVTLRCPECEWLGGGIYEQAVVDRLDEALDRGASELLDDLELVTRANLEESVQRFVAALDANQILPEDF